MVRNVLTHANLPFSTHSILTGDPVAGSLIMAHAAGPDISWTVVTRPERGLPIAITPIDDRPAWVTDAVFQQSARPRPFVPSANPVHGAESWAR